MDHGPSHQNHRNRRARAFRALLGAAALGAGLLLVGCDSESGTTPATPAPVAPPTPTDPVTEPAPPPGKDTPGPAFTRWYVETAIALYEAEGREAAVAAYSDPASVDGSWYLGIADEQGIVIAHPSPEAVGLSLRGAFGVDSSGKDFGNEIMTVTEEGLWVDYNATNPVSGVQEAKHTWVILHDGLIFGSGWYDGPPTNPDPAAQAMGGVQQALDRYRDEGDFSTILFYNDPASASGSWYVFIASRDGGTIVAHPHPPGACGEEPPGTARDRFRRQRIRLGDPGSAHERTLGQLPVHGSGHRRGRHEAHLGGRARPAHLRLRLVRVNRPDGPAETGPKTAARAGLSARLPDFDGLET